MMDTLYVILVVHAFLHFPAILSASTSFPDLRETKLKDTNHIM